MSKVSDPKINFIKYQESTGNCDSAYSDNCAQIKIDFPQIEYTQNKLIEEQVNKRIQGYFLRPVFDENQPESMEKLISNYLQEYDSFRKDFPEAFQHWSLERIGKVRYNSNGILSLEFSEYSYLGGAHPNSAILFNNIDMGTGEEIVIEDLFNKNIENKLTKVAESEFRKLKELNEYDDLGDAGFWFNDNQFHLNDNFLITDSSLIFYYNNYEITAYAFGPTELEIPYLKIKDLIKSEGLLSSLVN
jgi:hypothetical protein